MYGQLPEAPDPTSRAFAGQDGRARNCRGLSGIGCCEMEAESSPMHGPQNYKGVRHCCMHRHTQSCTRVLLFAYSHAFRVARETKKPSCAHLCIQVKHVCVHIYIYIYVRIHMHRFTYIYAYIHTYVYAEVRTHVPLHVVFFDHVQVYCNSFQTGTAYGTPTFASVGGLSSGGEVPSQGSVLGGLCEIRGPNFAGF